jgi:hypothetical protein
MIDGPGFAIGCSDGHGRYQEGDLVNDGCGLER